MPYLNLDKDQYTQLNNFRGVFEHFRLTGTANVNNDLKGIMREIFGDLFHQHLDTNCNTCLARGLTLLFDKIEQYELAFKPLNVN